MTYAERTILTDPMLSAKGELRSFAGIARNPTIELPCHVQEIVAGIESVMITHDHPDHFDKAASEAIPKETPVFCQPGDNIRITEEGFRNVVPIETSYMWEGIAITRTGGKHGSGEILDRMGKVSGFVLKAGEEPTVYWVGDSIWCEQVEESIEAFNPDVIITHSGGATLPGHDPIIMDAEQTITAANAAPQAIVVAIHMESLDHCTVSRETLRRKAESAAIPPSRLVIPKDGDIVSI